MAEKEAFRLDGNLLTLPEMARYLRCSPSTIYRMIWRRQLPVFKIGSDYRISRTVLERWVEERQYHQTTSGTPPFKR